VRIDLASLAFAAIAISAACDGGGRASDQARGEKHASSPADYAREQARFDSERHPDDIVAALAIKPGSRVADVGASSGLLTVHLARAVSPSGRVIATDIDSSVLDLLAARLEANGLSSVVERRVVAADTPGLEPNTYDAILLAEVDHYFPDPVAWLKSATAALKPGGRIVIANRIHHRTKSLDAAAKAGLVLISESQPVPSEFIATYTAPGATLHK
jgi:tRNA A58 N-methylase Trm61